MVEERPVEYYAIVQRLSDQRVDVAIFESFYPYKLTIEEFDAHKRK